MSFIIASAVVVATLSETMGQIVYSVVLTLLAYGIAISAEIVTAASTYTAGVVEFSANQTLSIETVSRKEAVHKMMNNLDGFEELLQEAQKYGVELVVFPEEAISGFMFLSRDQVYPFLEEIPDVSQSQLVNPCIDSGFEDREVLKRLSCFAKNYKIVLVANMGDRQPCPVSTNSSCPPDGRYQFNTDVIFENDGCLIAKYHKEHLYAGEKEIFDTPPLTHVSFQTSIGVKFGVFTCYDILYCDPPLELVEQGVKNFIFPTAWGNLYPFYVSTAFQQAWSRRTQTNLLASNQHFPNRNSFPIDIHFYLTGSGIYSSGRALSYFISGTDFKPASGKLLISKLPMDPNSVQRVQDSNVTGTNVDGIDMEDSSYLNYVSLSEQGGGVDQASFNFSADLSLQCTLEYKMKTTREKEIYALGAFIGPRPDDPSFIYAVCALTKCNSLTSCGQPVTNYVASTSFERIRLSGNFPAGSILFPTVMTTDLNLVEPSHVKLGNNFLTVEDVEQPVLAASLWSRVYNNPCKL